MKISFTRFLNKMEKLKKDFEPSDNYIDYPNLNEENHYILSLIKTTDFYFCPDYVNIKPGDIIQKELFEHFNLNYQQYMDFVDRKTELFKLRVDAAFED